jgi:hypothetical protein
MAFEPLRETEGIGFFKDNKIATPARVVSIASGGGKKQPKIEKDLMVDPGMGKPEVNRDPDMITYLDNSYNAG